MGCGNQVIKPLGFDDSVEEACNIFATVISSTLPDADAYEVAKATGLVELAITKFVSKSAVGILPEGSYLDTIGPNRDIVRIFKEDSRDGTPEAMFNQDELEGMRESTIEDCRRHFAFASLELDTNRFNSI